MARPLKRGSVIADAALRTGFSDQAHFQRTFKRLVAATPNQYRRSVQDEKDTTGYKQSSLLDSKSMVLKKIAVGSMLFLLA